MDDMVFENIEHTTIAQRIVDQVCKAISDGKYKPGDQIPTEPELARSLNVGRNSVREAIKILVAFGILEIRRSEGTFVCSGISKNMINPLIYGIIVSGGNSHVEAVEFQIAIDKAASRMCIYNYTEDDEMKLTIAYNDLMAAIKLEEYNIEEIYAKDKIFHEVIIDATHNEFMKIIYKSIWELLDTTIKLEIFTAMKEDRKNMIAVHENTYNAIIKRNEIAVNNAIRQVYYIDDIKRKQE